jgi:hypothetical protein
MDQLPPPYVHRGWSRVCDPKPEWEIPVRNEGRTHLGQIVSEDGEAFVYEYDMARSW